ncbi:hypothetical protein EDB81DRAFT_467113 [Dactylonectria macrodidyma]|uniref:Uncharacterized protein n=1 Tax=Dactylonectria macrodidyma TaxID=307937 RepID=A0A9P9J8V6_9HYPO|nr:hypothetical protein EDB81DRAFT_467113 [Dactylonectria macrodidyma]
MVVSTTRGRLLPPHVEATNISLSSASETFEDNKSASTPFDKEHSEEHHVTSKFVEAMKNPDWRRRPENTKSSTSTSSGFCTSETNDFHPQSDLEGSYSRYPSGGHLKAGRVGPWDHIAFSHRMSSHAGSEADTEPTETSESEDMGKARTYSDQWGLCGLVKQTELPEHGSNGEPMSIIELAPCWIDEGPQGLTDGSQDVSFSNMVHIQCIDPKTRALRKTPRKMPRNEQERELAAVLAATEATPPSMAAMASKCQSLGQMRMGRLPKPQTTNEKRHTLVDKPAVVPTYDARRSSMFNSKPPTTGTLQRDNPDFKKKHAAFQRMLQRLHRGANHMPKAP